MRARMHVVVGLVLAACGGANVAKSVDVPAKKTARSIASMAPSSASSASSAAATAVDAGPPPVDLLWETDSKVAVSTQVDNAADRPEHLVDRKEETAWNGRTGNLVGAWIKFKVPDDAHVDHVLMSAGFDKTTPKEDLFTENHRISKVRVYRAGKPLRDVTLDTNERKPQRIPIAAEGGEFQIEVLEVVSGTKAGWKEIAVSELAVMGTPGKDRKAKPGPPQVRIGTYDNAEVPYDETVAPTYLAACLAWAARDNESARKARSQFMDDSGPADTATCSGPTRAKPGKGAILETAHFVENEASKGRYHYQFKGEVLAMRTSAGSILTNIQLSGVYDYYYGTSTFKTRSEAWVGDSYVVEIEIFSVTDSDGAGTPEQLHSESRAVQRTTCEAATGKCRTVEVSKVYSK